VFRRRSDTATEDSSSTPEIVKPGGKGRPTPKRSEAEKRNRQPITAPRSRKEAYQQARERQGRDRQKTREGMARGDERYLLPRDKGPARRLARDYVDSRRTFGQYFMYLVLLIFLVMTAAPLSLTAKAYLQLLSPVLLVLFIGESIYLAMRVKKLARQRFPEENLRGIGFYTATRSMQIRQFRMPKPRLKPGQKDQV
jgi:hypothetical protein